MNTDTEEDSVVIYKNDKNGNQLATVNRYEIPSDKKDSSYVDIDVTLGDNRLNKNVVNHYNAKNELIRTLTKDNSVTYEYNADGLRAKKKNHDDVIYYIWDGDQLVLELDEEAKVTKRYLRGNSLITTDNGKEETTTYVTNPHGDVVQLLDKTGKVTKTYDYDAFGNEINPDEKDENPIRYAGEYFDVETGTQYLRARYYAPELGRFITRDTYTGEDEDSLSLHLYTYCENDGVNAWDPSGCIKISSKYLGFTIDFDGALHAYAPKRILSGKNKGKKNYAKPLDNLANAGKPGDWWGLAVNSKGEPYVRNEIDKKGRAVQYYISTTSLSKPNGSKDTPSTYVDSVTVPYIVTNNVGNLGKVCLVVKMNRKKRKSYSFGIVADYNSNTPSDTTGKNSGEGSSKLLKNLGGNGKDSYFGVSGDKFYVYIFDKKIKYPWNVNRINNKGKKLAKRKKIKYKRNR